MARFRTLQGLCRFKQTIRNLNKDPPLCYASNRKNGRSNMSFWHCSILLVLVTCFASVAGYGEENSPFTGSYSGKFTFRSSNPNYPSGEGMVRTLNIAANGRVTGTFNPPNGELGEFNGLVDEEGSISYTIQFATQTYVVKGLVTKTKRGSLKGNATQYAGRNAVGSVEFDLMPK